MNYGGIAKNVAAISAGAVGGKLITKYVGGMLGNVPSYVLPLAKIVIGAYVSEMKGKGKNAMLGKVGDGLIAQSALELGASLAPKMLGASGDDQSIMGDYEIEGTYDSAVYGEDGDIEGLGYEESVGSDVM